jgi:predicted aspartyl protease
VPILHSQAGGQANAPDGKPVQLTPPAALQLRGPVMQISVTINQNAAQALIGQGKTVPTKSGWALIDTGASNTCIDEKAAQELGLPVIDVASMQSASHEGHQCNVYPVQIITPVFTLNSPRTLGAALESQGLLVLIGRDVLQQCTLFYNGVVGQFTLTL